MRFHRLNLIAAMILASAIAPARAATTVRADYRVPIQTIAMQTGTNEVDRANYFSGATPGYPNTTIIQNHQFIGTKFIRIWADNTDWGYLDARIQAIGNCGATPFMCLEGYAGSANLQAYGDQCVAILNHCKGKYDISGWRWELLNEPNNNGRMGLTEYQTLYNTVEPRLRAAYANIQVGGPGTAGLALDWQQGLLQNAPAGGLQFVSWHRYGCYAEPNVVSDAQLLTETQFYEQDADQLAASVARLRPGVQLITGELNVNAWAGTYNGSWNTDPRIKSIFNAPWYTSAMKHLLRTAAGNSVALEMIWEGTGDDVLGGSVGFGIWYAQQPTVRGAPYFAKNLFVTACATGRELVQCDDGGNPNLEVLATRGGGKIALLLINKTTATTQVDARLLGATLSTGTLQVIDSTAFTAGAIRTSAVSGASTQSITLNGYAVALLTLNGSPDGTTSAPPAAPTNTLVTNPGNGTSLSLSWTNPADSDLDHVHIYRSTDPDTLGPKIADGITGAAYTDNGLTNGTTYYYVVRAVDQSGNESANIDRHSGKPTITGGLSILSVSSNTPTAFQGETAVTISMVVKNAVSSPMRIIDSHLVFTQGSADISSSFTVTPTTSYTTIAANAQVTYVYSVTVNGAAPLGAVKVDGVVTGYATASNLLGNDSFETLSAGQLTGWSPWSSVPTYTQAIDSSTKIDGFYSNKTTITNSGGAGDAMTSAPQVTCSPNTLYTFGTFWKTGGNVQVWKVMIVTEYDSAGNSLGGTWLWLDHVTAWNKGSMNFTTRSNTAKLNAELRISPRSAGQTESVWWDLPYVIPANTLLESNAATTPLNWVIGRAMTPLWTCPVGSPVRSAVTVEDGIAYVGADNGTLYAINAKGAGAGTIAWSIPTGAQIQSRPACYNGALYFTSTDGNLHAVSQSTHQELAGFPVLVGDAGLSTTPGVMSDSIYVSSNQGLIAKLSATTGETQADTGSILSGVINASPSIPKYDYVWIATDDGAVWRISSDLSVVLWKSILGGSPGKCSPTVIDNKLYLGTSQKKIWCIDSGYAGQIWGPVSTSGMVQDTLWVDGSALFGTLSDGKLIGLSTATGEILPGFPTPLAITAFESAPVAVQRAGTGTAKWVYVGSKSNRFFAVRADDPTDRCIYRGTAWFASSPAASGTATDDVAVIGSSDGKVYGFALR